MGSRKIRGFQRARARWRLAALGCRWLLVGVVLVVRPAQAESTRQDERRAARELGGEALELYDARRYEAALVKFTAAEKLVPVPTIKLMIARCLDKLGRMIEAAAKYREVIEAEISPDDPSVLEEARRDAVPELAALRERIPTVEIVLSGPGASSAVVKLDAALVPAEQLGKKRPVDPGTHVAMALEPGEKQELAREEFRLTRGEHARVVLELPASGSRSASDEAASPWRLGGWISVGVGGAALGVGAIVGIVLLRRQPGMLEQCPERTCAGEALDDAREFNTLTDLSTACFWAGVVGVAGGVTLLLVASAEDEDEAAAESASDRRRGALAGPEVALHATAAGAFLRGRF